MIDPTEFFTTRRSVVAANLIEGAPSLEDKQTILTAGMRVPDHGKRAPFKFIIFEGEARARFGQDVLAPRYKTLNPDALPEKLAQERARFTQAGLVIIVLSTPNHDSKIPEWEQVLTAGAAGMNMLACAQALGYGAQWLTQWYAYDDEVLKALGADPSHRHKMAGALYFGGKQHNPKDRPRPDPETTITYWT